MAGKIFLTEYLTQEETQEMHLTQKPQSGIQICFTLNGLRKKPAVQKKFWKFFSLVSVSQLINWLVVSQSCITNAPLLQSMGVEMIKDLKQSCRPRHLLWWVLSVSSSLLGSHCLFRVLRLCMISSARLPACSRSGSLPVEESRHIRSFFSPPSQ